jgi:hypothetical protein
MASRFVLTAQVQLQAPTNTRQVVNQIQQQLQGINVPINVQGGQQAAKQVNNITKATKQATTQAQRMGKAFGTSIRRFSAFSIASRGISLLTSGLGNATDEAIAFEREMIKISQVTGKTMGQLKGLENTITNLATSFGVSSKAILSVGRILAQAGIQANDLDVALTALAKTELSPTFEDITKTAEGAVAILAQFGEGVGALERQLGAISRVAGQFAVESGDLISVIRRTGGVFKAAGGDLEELLALFTSVRATTRESAESIATGLRTIFTRIQRPKTIEFLKQFGVQLTDLNGKFIGPYEAIRQLSGALSGLEQGDIRFVRIAEELGGFRQIGKVIPLLQQFETAERARQAALEGGSSLDEDAAKAQAALAVQISKVKEEFQALIRTVTQSSAFQVFVKTALELASAFIKISETLTPLLPLLATVAAFKFARGAAGFARGLGAGFKGVKGFNTGGVVPGTGNRDTVPAMLTPGEFVIRKSSVQSIGAGNLEAMNAKGYAKGGPVEIGELESTFASSNTYRGKLELAKKEQDKFILGENQFTKDDTIQVDIQRKALDVSDVIRKAAQSSKERLELAQDYNSLSSKERRQGGLWESLLRKSGLLTPASEGGLYGGSSPLDGKYTNKRLAEAKRSSVSNKKLLDKRLRHEFKANALVGQELTGEPDELDLSGVIELTPNAFQVNLQPFRDAAAKSASKKSAKKRNAGGGISGSDTVPAMLTPGEFVFSKKAAQSIGYSNLSRMNTQGVKGFAKGGPVGFRFGGEVARQNISDSFSREGTALVNTMSKVDDIMNEFINSLTTLPEGIRESVALITKPFELTSQQKFSTNAGDRTGDQLRGVATSFGVGVNLKKAGEHTVKHEGAHQVDRALGGGKELASRQEGTFQNKVALELMKTMEKEVGASAYRLDAAELFADALAKAPAEVQKILVATTDAAEGSKKLAEYFEKAGGPVAGLADLSADEFGGVQNRPKPKQRETKERIPNQSSLKKKIAEQVGVRDSAKKRLGAVEGRLKTETDKKSGLEARRDALLKAQSSAANKSGVKVGQTKLGQGKGQEPLTKAQLKAKEQYEIITRELTEQTKLINESDNSIKTLNKSRDKYKSAIDTAQGKIVSSSEQLKELKGRKAVKPIDMVKPDGKVRDLTPEVFKLGRFKSSKPNLPVYGPEPPPVYGPESPPSSPPEDKNSNRPTKQTQEENKDSNVLQNILLAAGAMSAFIPQVEGATEGFGAVQNALPGAVAAFGALRAVSQSLPTFEQNLDENGVDQDGKLQATAKKLGNALSKSAGAALKSASYTTAAFKIIDAYTGVHLKAEEAIKTASEANDEGSLVAAQRAAAESANQEALNTAATGVGAAFAAVGSAIPGPLGKLVSGFGIVAAGLVKVGALESLFGITGDALQDFFSVLGLGPSAAQTKAQTTYTIQSARAQRILAESAKKASEELKEIEAGNLTATASLGAGGAAAAAAKATSAQIQSAQDLVKANKDQVSAIQGSSVGSFIDTFTGGTASLQQANKQLEKEQIKAGQDFIASQSERFSLATKEQVTASAAAGQTTSFDDFIATLDPSIRAIIENTDKMNGNSDEMDKLRKNFENQKKAVLENIKFIKAMNFGLSEVTSGITAYTSSLNSLTQAQETGFSTAGYAAETLATAISSAGKFISSSQLGQSLNALESNLKKFGANADQISGARELITGLNDLQKSAADALLAVKAGFKGGATSPEAIKNQLRDAIVGSIPDSSPIKQKLLDSFGKLELPPEAVQEFLNTGDVSVILDKAFGPIQEQVQKQLIGPLQEMAKQEQILVGLTKQRREAEKKLIDVQKQAIDTQIDAAKSFEEFGGAKFTPEREFDARRQQANLVLRDAGIQGLGSGSVDDIRSARDQIFNNFSRQQQLQNAAAAGGGGAFGGVEGVDRDRREELKAANQELINFTKQGIEARKKELELINKKNAAEKQALDSLLTGDIESFFDQAIGAAAGSALRTGNAEVASLFGAGALGKGLQGIQDTGLSDAENQRAASIAFGAFGLGGDAASLYTGTTREEEQIKAQGRELALMQGELASQSAEMEEMTVTAKEVVISAANVRLTEIGQQVSSAQAALNFSRGGAVYASRGMFIPRGTDTVPAMLTPGEFVVNRAAVQRGNNLQILRSMNSNSAPIQAAQGLSSGGPVRYRAAGSTGPELGGGMDFSKFEELVNKFQEVTDKLGNVNIKHMFEKLGTLDINHMFNGNMQQALKDEILAEAGNMMSRSKFNNDGSITTSDRSVLG